MRSLAVAALLVGLLGGPARAQSPADRTEAIAAWRELGRLTEEEALIYELWSVRAPEKLPEEIRALPPQRRDCATPTFVELFQRRARGELSEWAEREYKQSSRPTSLGSMTSSTYPVRVHWTSSATEARADDVLGYAEYSWQRQVGATGFRAPLGDDGGTYYGGSRDLDIYIGDAQGAGGFTAPEEDWPATARSDCTVWVMISEEITYSQDLMSTVAHEFNHVLQAAHDCTEWLSFWENSATYMQDVTYDNVNDYIYFLPDFQQNPQLPFEYHSGGASAYQYGGMLVALTLDEAYGSGDGTTLRRIWEECEQNSYQSYEPDFFDAIDVVTREQGGGGLDEYQVALTVWRYLAGSRDDGAHFSEGGNWEGICGDYCDVPVDRAYLFTQLPVSGQAATPVYVHSSSYIEQQIGRQYTGNLRVSFVADSAVRWGLNLICRGSGAASVVSIPVAPAGVGSGLVPVSSSDYCTLAVTNLGAPDYDPDDDFDRATRTTYSYEYGLTFVQGEMPAPTITGVSPGRVPCTATPEISILGTNFLPGANVTLGGTAATIRSLSPTEIIVIAAARTESGVLPVVVVNPDNQRAARNNALVYDGEGCFCACDATYECDDGCSCDLECFTCLCDATAACDEGCDCDPNCDSGCGCAAGDSASGGESAPYALLLIFGALWRRRGRLTERA
jgi:hypothetical protein